jgi:hypothetical protein
MATNPASVPTPRLKLDVQTTEDARVVRLIRLINLSKRVRELLGMTNVLSVFEATGQYFIKMG